MEGHRSLLCIAIGAPAACDREQSPGSDQPPRSGLLSAANVAKKHRDDVAKLVRNCVQVLAAPALESSSVFRAALVSVPCRLRVAAEVHVSITRSHAVRSTIFRHSLSELR